MCNWGSQEIGKKSTLCVIEGIDSLPSLSAAIEDYGGLVRSAADLGVSPQRLSNWLERGVPVGWCAEVERVLEVPRCVLRPRD